MQAVGCAWLLAGGKRGLEKESLRITRDGSLATTPHPLAWGSALTHPYITTDYSEALSELITPAFSRSAEVAEFLQQTHQFIYQELSPDELLWSASMPCAIKDDQSVPIAFFGYSNIGRMKHVYRIGLDYRYGRRMQAIAGVHFNYSLPAEFWPAFQGLEKDPGRLRDFTDRSYFALIRNFRRLGWLIPLLFGCSPIVGTSFLSGRTARFKPFDAESHYLPHATSLRMSDIGYKNKNQAALQVSYDNLDNYVVSLAKAISTPYPEYEVIGLYDGEQRIQLSSNVLQLENEFYSYIRPKRAINSGEKPSTALRERGVEYVEMRALDISTFSPTGVAIEDMHFLEVFLLLCLLAESAPIKAEELWAIEYNELTIALRGREPGLRLIEGERRIAVTEWAGEIFSAMDPICEILDRDAPDKPYRAALARQRQALADPSLLPSARVMQALRSSHQTFYEFTLARSREYAAGFRKNPLDAVLADQFKSIAEESLASQREIEASDNLSFEDFLARYFAERTLS
ncbi:MAG: glutamate--cysteine ligase [Gammaproteobacteria bacterium]|nr:glutamate--cysteine ligase [Gammaproteobacteria bacterium]